MHKCLQPLIANGMRDDSLVISGGEFGHTNIYGEFVNDILA